MPTLQFKGKNIIWNHHLSIPYHSLQEVEDLSFQGDKGADNLIIEGDNLVALKALLPQYSGKIDVVYIDPPYNTGDDNGIGKGWVYNDNVNSPLIREWLKKEVSKDDLTKHDKWLCMMTPRLKLLRELLTNSGVIFISIDDNEYHNLLSLCLEIFNEENFVPSFIWEKKKKPSFLHQNIGKVTEFIVCFTKDTNDSYPFSLETTTKGKKYPFNNAGNSLETLAFKAQSVQFGIDDQIIEPQDMSEGNIKTELLDRIEIKDGRNHNNFRLKGEWRYSQNTLNEIIENNEAIYISKIPFRPNHIKSGGEIKKMKNIFSPSHYNMQTNEDAKKQLEELFGRSPFDYPKPVDLIKALIKATTYHNANAIILDSFAGSGTTMHAVNELNKDGGNRKCILVQMTEATEAEPDKNICRDITRERNKLAIEKYGYDSGFRYLKVGTAIDPDTMLDGELPTYQQFAEYVFYLATGGHLAEKENINSENHFVGTEGSQAIYLIYEQDFDKLTRMALTLDIAEQIIAHSPGKRRTVFAPSCFLDEDYMTEKQIEFVSVPYNLFERNTAD